MNEDALQDAIHEPKNLGEMADADAVGTVGSPECGDMVRMWLKFTEVDGRRVIDRASFQSFGCQTAIAVASMATEMLKGRTPEEAMRLSTDEMTRPLGPLPPVKIHCGQMVEGALRAALAADAGAGASGSGGSAPSEARIPRQEAPGAGSPTLAESLYSPASTHTSAGGRKLRIVPLEVGRTPAPSAPPVPESAIPSDRSPDSDG